jgi:hypothetical protein
MTQRRTRTQMEMFYQAQRELGELNEMFDFLVKTGLTKEDLAKNIERRPALWKRWENWLDQLPSRTVVEDQLEECGS